MQLHDHYKLTKVINATGTFTPLGVSRSSTTTCQAVSKALSEFFVIDELQAVASDTISQLTGAEAGTVTHCVSAGVTLSIAAIMAGDSPEKVAVLPDVTGMPHRVVLPAGHAVNYGHPIIQDIRLAGAEPVIVGTEDTCTLEDLDEALAHVDTACLLLVSSRLVRGNMLDFNEAVAIAHQHKVPAIIDGAAQDFRSKDLLATGADLVLTSAHKYMASPTAGLIFGRKRLVDAVHAHEKGIGRAMKATKEAIVGVLSALEERQNLNLRAWQEEQETKVDQFVDHANKLHGVDATSIADPTGLPFTRACLTIDPNRTGMNAVALAQALKIGSPPIWTMDHECDRGRLIFELVPLRVDELEIILKRLAETLPR